MLKQKHQQNKGRLRLIMAGGLLCLFLASWALGHSAQAASESRTNTVTITVVGKLSITDDVGNFSLTFNDFIEGGYSTTQLVNYTVKGNRFPYAALNGVVSAKISSDIDGVDLQADVGTYIHIGSQNNITLTEQNSGYTTVATSPVDLAKKGATSGGQGKVLFGKVPITWRGYATRDLTAGDYTTDLTVTLKDS